MNPIRLRTLCLKSFCGTLIEMKLISALLLLVTVLISSCSTGTKAPGTLQNRIKPPELLAQACMPGTQSNGVSGVAWLKAKSSKASGQFPANIQATAPDRLRLEVETPFGGTYAVLTIKGGAYKVVVPGKPEQSREGKTSWGGIPLKWATDLFLGRIPCPDAASRATAHLSITNDDELVVEVPAKDSNPEEKFVFMFDEKSGKFSPKSLHWEKDDAEVDFQFSDPDPKTLSPLKWQAKSAQGEVKIRWKDREIIDSKPQVR